MRPQQKVGAAAINLTLSQKAREFLKRTASLRSVSRTQVVEDLIQAEQEKSKSRMDNAKKDVVNGMNEMRKCRNKK